jgi:hypothetical protein
MSDCSKTGAVILSSNTRAAFLVGRQIGMRCVANDAAATIDQLMDELAQARAETARLAAELERERHVAALAKELLRRTNVLIAMDEIRDTGATLH